jgi:hypothetical protein
LESLEVRGCAQDEHHANGKPLHHWGISQKIIDALNLLFVSSYTETCLELSEASVRESLYLESPSARNNVGSLWNIVHMDFNPGFSLLKFEELSLESFYPVFLLFAGHRLSERMHIRVGTLDGLETERVSRDGSINDPCFPIMEKK